jgi:pimeloyl-ACP methyl ester carboxylesterase
MVATQERIVTALETVSASVEVGGAGPPIVFLHGETGLQWSPFLDALAGGHTVYAPRHPGTRAGDPDAIRKLDTLWDLVLYYGDLFDGLGLGPVPIIGHSFGGMVAAEFAATYPRNVAKLVLLNPLGLWREDEPVANWMAMKPADLLRATYSDPNGALALAMAAAQANPAADPEAMAASIWSLACTGRFTWPIPDKGLKKRIYRISAPTLLVWGRDDGIVPCSYAADFAGRLQNARVEIVENAAHVPHLEQLEAVTASVERFLAE